MNQISQPGVAMRFIGTIKHMEWMLFLIIGYYLLLTFVLATIYFLEGAHIQKLTIITLSLVVILLSALFSKGLLKLASRFVYAFSSIYIILFYLSVMAFLLVVLPLYINLLLNVFVVIPT